MRKKAKCAPVDKIHDIIIKSIAEAIEEIRKGKMSFGKKVTTN